MRISDWSSEVCASDLADAFDLLLAGALRQGGRAQGLTPRGAGQGAGKHNSGEGGGESGKQQLLHRKTSPSCCYVLLPKGSRGRRPQVKRQGCGARQRCRAAAALRGGSEKRKLRG